MKKKIINGILAVALLVSASSAFVSCKDNDADATVELNGKIADLQRQIDNIKVIAGPEGPAGQDGKDGRDGKDADTADIYEKIGDLQDQINALDPSDPELSSKIADLEDAIEALETAVKEEVAGMVTSVNILATENPVIGTAALPVNVKSTILASYYNELPKAITSFPSKEVADIIGVEPLKADAGEEIGSEAAGKIYLTLNPSNVDLSSVNVELANSQNEAAPVELSPLAVSDEVISFGYTRANTILYETTAKITDYEAAKVDIDMDNLKAQAKDVLKNKRNLGAYASLAANIVNEASGILPANYLTVSKTSELLGTREVTSETAIAVTAIKPLSFEFLAGKSFSLPINRAESLIDNVLSKINLDFGIDLDAIGDAKITLERDKDFNIEVNVEVPIKENVTVTGTGKTEDVTITLTAKDANGNVVTIDPYTLKGQTVDIEAGTTLDFKVNTTATANINDVVDDLFAQFEGNLENINELLAQVQKLADLTATIDSTKNNIKNQIYGYLDLFNSKFESLTSKFNTALQPVLIAVSGSKVNRVPASQVKPYQAHGTIKLVPTTYTGEILAPAYKKILAVTAIDGSTSGVKDFNKKYNLAQFVDGDATFYAEFEAGKTYELTYAAVDFYGNIVENKYYVKGN